MAASHRDVRPITCLRDNKIKKPEPGGEYWIAVAAIARQRLRTQSKGGCRWLNRRHLVAPRGSVCARVMSALAPRTGQTSAGGFSHQSASPLAMIIGLAASKSGSRGPRLGDRHGFRERTFAGTPANGRNAPKAVSPFDRRRRSKDSSNVPGSGRPRKQCQPPLMCPPGAAMAAFHREICAWLDETTRHHRTHRHGNPSA